MLHCDVWESGADRWNFFQHSLYPNKTQLLMRLLCDAALRFVFRLEVAPSELCADAGLGGLAPVFPSHATPISQTWLDRNDGSVLEALRRHNFNFGTNDDGDYGSHGFGTPDKLDVLLRYSFPDESDLLKFLTLYPPFGRSEMPVLLREAECLEA